MRDKRINISKIKNLGYEKDNCVNGCCAGIYFL
jgi:hypothetical protein